jgi:glycosyltransferase involved in cell wall biosynthesis
MVLCHPDACPPAALAERGIRVERLRIRHRLDFPSAFALRRRLLEFRPEVIYAPGNSALSVALFASAGMRVARVAYRGTIGHLSRWDPAAWLTYLHPRVDRIWCVSNAVRDYLRSLGLAPEKLAVIYKGHDLAWYAAPPTVSRADLGIPDGAFLAGFVGSVRQVKGVDVLLKAVAGLPHALRAYVLLAGEMRDPEVARLVQTAPLRERVRATGFRADAASLMRLCDAFVMPSRAREGLPRAVLEAMAQGVPVVVSRVGGMPELVVDRDSGLVVPPSDPSALATALRTLAEHPDLRRRYGVRGKQRVATHFSIGRTIQQAAALFEAAAAGCGGGSGREGGGGCIG